MDRTAAIEEERRLLCSTLPFIRFSSRGEDDFARKVLSAIRFSFESRRATR
jgi:6-phosphogluconate dehydrogenase (decarboxylating)